MGTRNTFRVLFYIKRSAPLRNGETPIMGRITINGQRAQLSTRLTVDPLRWNVGQGRVEGRSAAAVRINAQLEQIRQRIERCYDALLCEGRPVTPQRVRARCLGDVRSDRTVLAFFREHNETFGRMVDVSRSKTTYYKYRCVCDHLARFIRDRYGRADLGFRELDREFLAGFHRYLVCEGGYRKNTAWIYLIALKHVLMLARGRGYLERDLFADYKLRSETVARNYLSLAEIRRLIRLEPDDPTQRLVRDAFVFSCFTGLSYVDLVQLTLRQIHREGNRLWIGTTRRKTGSDVQVRLFSIPCALLERYRPADDTTRIFRLPGNGWCNVCLRRIMPQAGITRPITFHAARHTFATTITLSQGVSIETISKLLGHKNIRTTQIYATITHAKLDGDMERLSKRLDALCRDRDLRCASGAIPIASRD